jgi:Holliday junction DNA helicase RuvA
MIAMLSGIVREVGSNSIILDVHGVGYNVLVPDKLKNTIEIEQPLTISIVHLFKQDAQYLCGFSNEQEKMLFEALLTVHGVGLKAAMSVVSSLPIEEFATAVIIQKPEVFNNINGIGKKTAERILLELKDKNWGQIKNIVESDNGTLNDVLSGLISLGYNKNKATKTLSEVAQMLGKSTSADVLIIECLKKLAN